MIKLLHVFSNALVPVDMAHDQGGFNFINVSGKIGKARIPVAPPNPDDRVRHSSLFAITKSFPNIKTMYNQNLTAIVLHHYYHSSLEFKISLLLACPRPDPSYTSYPPHCDENCMKFIESKMENMTYP